MTKNIGIDLGTTYCSIATIDEAGRPIIVKNPNTSESPNGVSTASCIMLSGKKFIIGASARRSLGIHDKAVGRFKRSMGSDDKFHLGDRECQAKDLSTILLTKLREAAEKELGEIGKTVVTIPANFENEARDDTLEAAKDAGLDIDFLLNEPTAAALYYAHTTGALNGIYAIYDLGGGTFDISIIKAAGDNIEIISSNGIRTLGGDDFDKALISLVQKKFKELGKDLTPEDYTLTNAEDDKIMLSRKTKTIAGGDEVLGEIVEITRLEFEKCIASLVTQTEIMLEATIAEANVDINDINDIVMVGGSVRIPIIAESIKKVFKKEPILCDKTDEAVALGAALYANYKDQSKLNEAQKDSMGSLNITDVANHCFGTFAQTENSAGQNELQNSVIIEKNTRLPVSVTKTYVTASDNQTGIDCKVTQCTQPETNKDYVKIIGEGHVDLPPNRPAGQPIEITFVYDENEIMKCTFKDVESGNSVDLDFSINSSDEDDIDKFLID
jgi:molecular chaperone DnaK